jgi:hypothetical protein
MAIMPVIVNKPGELLPGDLYEDCRYHPCVCIEANLIEDLDGVYGISLINGSPSGCSIAHCALRKLTIDEAVSWKRQGPTDEHLSAEDRWW